MSKYAKQAEMTTQGRQVAVGKNLYVFDAGPSANSALISAHGGFWTGTKTFLVPNGVTLHFYTPHGNVLSDPGISFLANKPDMKPTETANGGEYAWDYELSKYQGRHGKTANETYQKINTWQNQTASMGANIQESIGQATAKGDARGLQKLQAWQSTFEKQSAHIITIRNRFSTNFKPVTLSDVVGRVLAKFPQIKTFHCSHCRSDMES